MSSPDFAPESATKHNGLPLWRRFALRLLGENTDDAPDVELRGAVYVPSSSGRFEPVPDLDDEIWQDLDEEDWRPLPEE